MTLQEKVKKEIPIKKISLEFQEFIVRVDHLRTIAKDLKVSFSQVLLNARKGK